ncbi:MAG: hypothetical protein J6C23_05425 [Clostridia bacterium]|nr:hypothetical protein [Clostridia bacterium]
MDKEFKKLLLDKLGEVLINHNFYVADLGSNYCVYHRRNDDYIEIDDKNKTIYVIKESVGGENKVSNIIEKLILKDIKNNLTSKEEVNHYDGN